MRRAGLDQFFTLIRKNWLLILLVGAAVCALGLYLYQRQEPLFEARVKLKIVRSAQVSSGDVTFTFEEDQVFYNTQYNLLRTQLDWAEEALDRAAWLLLARLEIDWRSQPAEAGRLVAGKLGPVLDPDEVAVVGAPAVEADFPPLGEVAEPDVRIALDAVRSEVLTGRWGFSADSLLGSVSAQPIPSTYLAELKLTARDRAVAVLLVNLYAELYRDVSREERKETLEGEIAVLRRQRDQARSVWEEARDALAEFRGKHPELHLGSPVNLPGEQALVLAQRVEQIETEALLRSVEEKSLRETLRERGIEVVEDEGTGLRLDVAGDPEALPGKLAGDLRILGLEVVQSSDNVAAVRSRIRTLEQERERLPADLTDESPPVRRLDRRLADERHALGVQVAAALTEYLGRGRRNEATLAQLSSRLKTVRQEARELDELYSRLETLTRHAEELARERESLDRGYATLQELFSDGERNGGGHRFAIQNIRIERRARFQDALQVRPNTPLILVLTFVAAVLFSLGVAWLRDFIDDTIKTVADFESHLDLPTVGQLPRLSAREDGARDTWVRENPRSPAAEAFRSLRTGILFSRRDAEIRTLLLTSAGPSEGKTTVAVNLAITMAEADQGPVLLIDADLRRARIHRALGLDNVAGLTNCLVGTAGFRDVVRPARPEGLFVLPAGPAPPNPAELLGGDRMKAILDQAREEYARVILDTTPLLAVTDANLLAKLVDGVFVVVTVGKSSWRLVQHGCAQLAQLGVTPAGVILNSARPELGRYNYQYETTAD